MDEATREGMIERYREGYDVVASALDELNEE